MRRVYLRHDRNDTTVDDNVDDNDVDRPMLGGSRPLSCGCCNSGPPRALRAVALIEAAYTAQLHAPQNEGIFSKAEEKPHIWQRAHRAAAIGVLSSTTTMEAGIADLVNGRAAGGNKGIDSLAWL